MPHMHCRPQIVANHMSSRLARIKEGEIDVLLHNGSCPLCQRNQECSAVRAILARVREYGSNQFIYQPAIQ